MNELFSAPFFIRERKKLACGDLPGCRIRSDSPHRLTRLRQAYFEPNPGPNYVMQWNLTIQREIHAGLSLRIGYVGSRAVHSPSARKCDIVLPTLTPQGYLWPSPVGSGTRLNPNAGPDYGRIWDGRSYYDALQIQIKRRSAMLSVGRFHTEQNDRHGVGSRSGMNTRIQSRVRCSS